MGEGVEAAFNLMKDRIRSTHVHDNNGKDDSHLFPLLAKAAPSTGRTPWNCCAAGEDQYPLLLELKEQPGMTHPLDEREGSLRAAGEPVNA